MVSELQGPTFGDATMAKPAWRRAFCDHPACGQPFAASRPAASAHACAGERLAEARACHEAGGGRPLGLSHGGPGVRGGAQATLLPPHGEPFCGRRRAGPLGHHGGALVQSHLCGVCVDDERLLELFCGLEQQGVCEPCVPGDHRGHEPKVDDVCVHTR